MDNDDRKRHDGTLPPDEYGDFEPIDLNFADPAGSPLPAINKDDRAEDPEQYGRAVLQHLESAAFLDIGEIVEWSSSRGVIVKSSKDLTPVQRRLIKSIGEDKDGNIKVTFVDKDRALQLLGEAAGVLKKNVDLNGKIEVSLLETLKMVDGRSRGIPRDITPVRALPGPGNGDD